MSLSFPAIMSQQNFIKFVIQSKIDNQQFTVDRKIIDASALLKNICDITEITEPILVDCPSESLEVYIKLINNYYKVKENEKDEERKKNLQFFYKSVAEENDEDFAETLYNSFTAKNKNILIKLIQDLCILDSDIFLDSISDYILGIFENEEKEIEMDWMEIQEYLGLESDFSKNEQHLIQNDKKLEYFHSVNFKNFKFPFQNQCLYSLKTEFSTPMNSLIARIIQRSNAKVSYLLSLINKAIKNEVDRMPYKVVEFSMLMSDQFCYLCIKFKKLERNFEDRIDFKYLEDLEYIFKRKITAQIFTASYGEESVPKKNYPLNFVIADSLDIIFYGFKSMYHFDVTKCTIPSIYYKFFNVRENEIKFEVIYNHLVAKDLSKSIRIYTCDFFKLADGRGTFKFRKLKHDSKFKIFIMTGIYLGEHVCPEFEIFITDYMDDNGIIKMKRKMLDLPNDKVEKVKDFYDYSVWDVKKYFGINDVNEF